MWAINQAGKSALLSNESSTALCVLCAPCVHAGVGEQGSHPTSINIVKEEGVWERGFWRAGLGILTLLECASLG